MEKSAGQIQKERIKELKAKADGVFPEMIAYLQANNIPLAGAVHDFTCPQTGTNYMYFPIRRL